MFEQIAKTEPQRLFVIADGPRPDQPEDIKKCAAACAIIDRVDWDCEVYKNYSDVNMGVRLRPATGISWVFEQADFSTSVMQFPLRHPPFVFRDYTADKFTIDRFFSDLKKDVYYNVIGCPLYYRIYRRLKRYLDFYYA